MRDSGGSLTRLISAIRLLRLDVLYETLQPAEARRILERLELHYTPKHGCWLNMAEIEIGVMNRQCLDRRIDDKDFLTREVAAWDEDRNTKQTGVDCRFTTTPVSN